MVSTYNPLNYKENKYVGDSEARTLPSNKQKLTLNLKPMPGFEVGHLIIQYR